MSDLRPPCPIVIDTNIALDMFVFRDPATHTLLAQLSSGSLAWQATAPMREELLRVLAYPHIDAKLGPDPQAASAVLAQFDQLAHIQAVAPKVAVTCKDADDQKFIDLAVAHQALLVSKDKAVLCMTKRLLPLGVTVRKNF